MLTLNTRWPCEVFFNRSPRPVLESFFLMFNLIVHFFLFRFFFFICIFPFILIFIMTRQPLYDSCGPLLVPFLLFPSFRLFNLTTSSCISDVCYLIHVSILPLLPFPLCFSFSYRQETKSVFSLRSLVFFFK